MAPPLIDPWIRFWKYVGSPTEGGCWPWIGAVRRRGYGVLGVLHDDGRRRNVAASRFIWEHMYGPIPAGKQVLHRCDNPSCVRPAHIFLGTASDNAHDRMSKGRWVRPWFTGLSWQSVGDHHNAGEGNGMAKLTREDVVSIRHRYSEGVRIVDLAGQFHVSAPAISAIVNRKSWVN